jgi:hypothetical protein
MLRKEWIFFDKNGASIVINYDVYKDNYVAMQRGCTIRLIIEITQDNLQHCKETDGWSGR